MAEIQIIIPDQQTELEAAVADFVKDTFAQDVHFKKETISNDRHKDFGLLNTIMQNDIVQIATLIAILESNLQFAERIKRMESVKKLLNTIKKTGKSVYLKINQGKMVDLSQKSADETMDLLIGDDKKQSKKQEL